MCFDHKCRGKKKEKKKIKLIWGKEKKKKGRKKERVNCTGVNELEGDDEWWGDYRREHFFPFFFLTVKPARVAVSNTSWTFSCKDWGEKL